MSDKSTLIDTSCNLHKINHNSNMWSLTSFNNTIMTIGTDLTLNWVHNKCTKYIQIYNYSQTWLFTFIVTVLTTIICKLMRVMLKLVYIKKSGKEAEKEAENTVTAKTGKWWFGHLIIFWLVARNNTRKNGHNCAYLHL